MSEPLRDSLPDSGHEPVLLEPVLAALDPQPGDVVIDCTLGRGGHALHFANAIGPTGLLVGLDQDPRNLAFARERLRDVSCESRFFHGNFAELADVVAEIDRLANVIFADLGVSTNQLFDAHYGLSFSTPMPLDMRLDPRLDRSAADLVNHLREEELADLLFHSAQERFARRIARKVVAERRVEPIITTERLAEVVSRAIPARFHPRQIHPATRTFMALRMAVNRETESLDAFLKTAPRQLEVGGRLGVITFHSTEDRQVKQAFRSLEQAGVVRSGTPKPISPSDDELRRNPRSRSAKLRTTTRV